MSQVHDLSRIAGHLRHGGQPPDNPGMEVRIAQLEALAEKTGDRLSVIDKQLTRIEARQEEFTKHYATKADLTDAKNSIIMWVVGAVFLAQLLPALLKKFGL